MPAYQPRPYAPSELRSLYIDLDKTAQELADRYNVSKLTMRRWLQEEGFTKQVKVSWDESLIDETCPIFNYLMGLAATDGYVDLNSYRLSIRLQSYDKKVLDNLSKHFKLSTGVRLYKRGEVADLTLPSKNLINVAASVFNVTRQKTYNLCVPEKFHSEDCLRMYLRGVIDGDGNVRIEGKKSLNIRLYCGSETFVDGLLRLINTQFSYDCKKSYHKCRGKSYPGFTLHGKRSFELALWLYAGLPLFRIERKFEKFEVVYKSRMKI